MGGNALKSDTRRLEKNEYFKTQGIVRASLLDHFGIEGILIPAYSEKDTFGDLDLIVNLDLLLSQQKPNEGIFFDIQQFVQQNFYSRSELINSNCFSFEYRETNEDIYGFQVDLIAFPENDIKTGVDYYSYNDLGNLTGRVAESVGLKYGHKGLQFNLVQNNNLWESINVSKDTQQILTFLGYDFKKFSGGFKNLDDIFSYVKSSCYFHKDYYLLENRNYKSRVRDKKRTTYRAFLEHLENDKKVSPKPPAPTLNQIFLAFPDFKERYKKSCERFEVAEDLKRTFNGSVVSEITNLRSAELGSLMHYIRKKFATKEEMLLHFKASSDVQKDVLAFFSEYSSQIQQQKKSSNSL